VPGEAKLTLQIQSRRWLLRLACTTAQLGFLSPANVMLRHVWHYRVGGGSWRRLEPDFRFVYLEDV